jgi:Protein of unknown function (DUF3311)
LCSAGRRPGGPRLLSSNPSQQLARANRLQRAEEAFTIDRRPVSSRLMDPCQNRWSVSYSMRKTTSLVRLVRISKGAGNVRKPTWPALLLGLIPFVGMCFTVSLWDRIHPFVAGLPFNLFWLILWILLTPLCLWGAYRFEKRPDIRQGEGRRSEAR